jgi:hypothetical protein
VQANKQLQINRLLRQREVLFESILDYEIEMEALLGNRQHIPPPPELPSVFRRSRVRKSTKSSVVKIRRLNKSEDCYRITFYVNGEIREDFVRDLRLVRRLVELEIDRVVVKKIETVALLDGGEFVSLELLYFNRDFLEKNEE